MAASHLRRVLVPVAALAALLFVPAGGAWASTTTTTTADEYSGQACLLKTSLVSSPVARRRLVRRLARSSDLVPGSLGCTPELAATGGAEQASILTVPSTSLGPLGSLNGADVYSGQTTGTGNASHTHSSLADLDATIAGLHIQADFVQAESNAACTPAGAVVSGSSELVHLVINDMSYDVGTTPNQVVLSDSVAGVIVTTNVQSGGASGDSGALDVTALEITVLGVGTVDLITAHADVHCVTTTTTVACVAGATDFITGGGWFYSTLSQTHGQRHFADSAGYKNGAIWGHLVYMDKALNVKVEGDPIWYGPSGIQAPALFENGTAVTPEQLASDVFGALPATITNARYIVGTLRTGGAYFIRTVDAGEPGRHVDQFDIAFLQVSTTLLGGTTYSYTTGAYAAASDPTGIEGGNVQLHGPCGGNA